MKFLVKPFKVRKMFMFGCTGIECSGFSICVYD